MRAVETAEHKGRGTFDTLAERSGFSVLECRLAAATGRLAGIVRVAQARDAGRKRLLEGLPPVPPVLSGREALARMRMRRTGPRG
jgi:hypothetical protein